jgi:hypothetical protein
MSEESDSTKSDEGFGRSGSGIFPFPYRRSFRSRLPGTRTLLRGEGIEQQYEVIDLSKGGILLKGTPRPPIGAEVDFHLFGPNGQVVPGKAAVVRHLQAADDAFAIGFIDLDHEASETVIALLTHRLIVETIEGS